MQENETQENEIGLKHHIIVLSVYYIPDIILISTLHILHFGLIIVLTNA